MSDEKPPERVWLVDLGLWCDYYCDPTEAGAREWRDEFLDQKDGEAEIVPYVPEARALAAEAEVERLRGKLERIKACDKVAARKLAELFVGKTMAEYDRERDREKFRSDTALVLNRCGELEAEVERLRSILKTSLMAIESCIRRPMGVEPDIATEARRLIRAELPAGDSN